jgi:hypothetical protein
VIFHSTHPRELVVTIASRCYRIAPGGEVEIPDHLAYVVQSRGLPLVQDPSSTVPVATREEPAPVREPTIPDEELELIAAGLDPDEMREMSMLADTPTPKPDPSDAVDSVVADLEAQGIRLPGPKRSRRGR